MHSSYASIWIFFGLAVFGFIRLDATAFEVLNGIFSDMEERGSSGWYESETFGIFHPIPDSDWAYHDAYGFLFIREDTEREGFFVYQFGVGWWWASSESFPYVYRFVRNEWGFLEAANPGATVFYLYSFSFERWVTHAKFRPLEAFPYYFPEAPHAMEVPPDASSGSAVAITPSVASTVFQESTLQLSTAEGVVLYGGVQWGDGTFSEFQGSGELTHQYRRPGSYVIEVTYDGDFQGSETILVTIDSPAFETYLEEVSPTFLLYGRAVPDGTTSFLGNGNSRPDPVIQVDCRYRGAGGNTVSFELVAESPSGVETVLATESDVFFPFLGEGTAEGTVTFEFQPVYPQAEKGITLLWVRPVGAEAEVEIGLLEPLAYWVHPDPDPVVPLDQEEVTLMQVEAGLARAEWQRQHLLDRKLEFALERDTVEGRLEAVGTEASSSTLQQAETTTALAEAVLDFETRFPEWQLVLADAGEALTDAQEDEENALFPSLASTDGPDLPLYRPVGSRGRVGAFPNSSSYLSTIGVGTVPSGNLTFNPVASSPFWVALDSVAVAYLLEEKQARTASAAETFGDELEARSNELLARLSPLESDLSELEAEINLRKDLIDDLIAYRTGFEAQLEALLVAERLETRTPRILSQRQETADALIGDVGGNRTETRTRLEAFDGGTGALDPVEVELAGGEASLDQAETNAANLSTQLQLAETESDPSAIESALNQAETELSQLETNLLLAVEVIGKSDESVSGYRVSPCEDGATRTGDWTENRFFFMEILDVGVGTTSVPTTWASSLEGARPLLADLYAVAKIAETLQWDRGEITEAVAQGLTPEAISALALGSTSLTTDFGALADDLGLLFPTAFTSGETIQIQIRAGGFLYRSRVNEVCEAGLWRVESEEIEVTQDPAFLRVELPPVEGGSPQERETAAVDALKAWVRYLGVRGL